MLRATSTLTAILALTCIVSLADHAGAAQIAMNPVADSFVSAANPNNNYGGGGALSVAASGLANGEFQSLIRYDTSTAKTSFDATYGAGQWSVTSVMLRLTSTAPNSPIFNASAAGQFSTQWMQNDSWVEGTGTPAAPTTTGITFATLPSFLSVNDAALGTFSYNGATSGSTIYTLGLQSGLTSDIVAGNLMSLRLFAADSAVSYLFNSRNFGTASARPELTITATPEPASLALLLSGVFIFGRIRRSAAGKLSNGTVCL